MKWNALQAFWGGKRVDWTRVYVRACGWARAHAALADAVCGCTEKERKSESGLSVISVTLSGRLPLTNERCWQPGCILPWLCWVGRICFRAFVRFILPPLLSLPLCLSLFPSFFLFPSVRESNDQWSAPRTPPGIPHGDKLTMGDKVPQNCLGDEEVLNVPYSP